MKNIPHIPHIMLIRYLSDLHLEFIKPKNLQKILDKIKSVNNKEVCVLAGDIGNPYQPIYDNFMEHINETFKKTFVISGNHEYYNKTKTIEETNAFLENYFKKFDNISFLNNSYEHHNDNCFVGTTLWSKIYDPFHEINDVYQIPSLDCNKYNHMHNESVEFLKQTLLNNKNNIIITHHMPSFSLIDTKYTIPSMTPYHQWFSSDMDEFINEHQNNIKCWIYGHTHMPSNKTINNIPFLCNPIGYPNENNVTTFDAQINL